MAERFTPARGDSPARRDGWPSSGRPDDDAWGPSTSVYSEAARPSNEGFRRALTPPEGAARTRSAPRSAGAGRPAASARPHGPAPRPGVRDEGWAPAGPASRDQQRANKLMERQLREMRTAVRPVERGLRWWAALVVLIVIAVIGGLIDTIGTSAARGGFNIGIVVASIVAILLVKRSHMFPVVIAPPIVYSLAAVFQLYLRSSGLHDKKVVLDAAANYLVYGFPAIAAATAAVLIIAGARLILRK